MQVIAELSRREMLRRAACGFGSLALAGLAAEAASPAQAAESADPLAARLPHHPPRAKRVIFIFMQGGPSQVDTFDHKPRLEKENGERVRFKVARTRKVTPEKVMQSPWKFARHGECGQWVSDLFPEVARHVDDLCFLQGMHTEGVAHGPATLFLHTGATNLVRPSVGSWITYGLGTENRNVPGFITLNPSAANGGPRNYSNSFLPTVYQGTVLGRAGLPAEQARFDHVGNAALAQTEQEQRFALLQSLNREQARHAAGGDELNAVIDSFELAFRMQAHAPGMMDFSKESRATRALYGIDEKPTHDFGVQCLLARRMAEAGVRYVQISYADNTANPRWDQHSNIKAHATHARATDKPVAGLLADLKARGLLEDTLVWWGGEFGRCPFAENSDGRDHNPNGFTIWLAGGGVKPGFSWGETDEYGYDAVTGKVHMHDLHATVLHLLGLDHKQLTYQYAGRDFRLTDVAGNVVHEIIA
ncbi:MAG: DUF1501 domain-containing protein [Planctomycetaceae bacterium]